MRSGTFEGYVDAYLYAWEITAFVDQLQSLYTALTGEAVLEGQEGDLHFRLEGNGRGAITVEGTLRAFGRPRPLSLDFYFVIDQTYLPAFLAGLKKIVSA